VIDIDVDKSKFSRFQQMFDKFQQAQKGMPKIWQEAGKVQQQSIRHFGKLNESAAEQNKLMRGTSQATEMWHKNLQQTDRLWTSMANCPFCRREPTEFEKMAERLRREDKLFARARATTSNTGATT
jgi:response regulator of citrate/malate metabolism